MVLDPANPSLAHATLQVLEHTLYVIRIHSSVRFFVHALVSSVVPDWNTSLAPSHIRSFPARSR